MPPFAIATAEVYAAHRGVETQTKSDAAPLESLIEKVLRPNDLLHRARTLDMEFSESAC